VAFALRCLFFLLLIGGLALFLYLYRRKTNQIVAIVLFSYAVGVSSRLLTLEADEDVVRHGVLALGGLAILWGGVWLGARYLEKRGWPPDDSV
jgi:hypothetical protein